MVFKIKILIKLKIRGILKYMSLYVCMSVYIEHNIEHNGGIRRRSLSRPKFYMRVYH